MMTLVKICRWLLQRIAGVLLIALLAIAGCGLWLFLRDNLTVHEWQQDSLRLLSGQRAQLQSALSDVEQRLNGISERLAAEQARLRQAEKVIADLRAQESTWDRLIGNPEQQQKNEERLASVTALHGQLRQTTGQLQEQYTRTTWERDGLRLAQGKLELQLQELQTKRSAVVGYLERIWGYEVTVLGARLPLRWWIALAGLLYLVGPSLAKLLLYFGVAPIVAKGRPVRLQEHADALPTLTQSRVALDVTVAPGERLWIKEVYLQAADEGFVRRTRYLFDWRLPLTSLAAGLVELVELANAAPSQVPAEAGATAEQGTPLSAMQRSLRATLSNQSDPHTELSLVFIPQGASLVLRPRFLVGALNGQPGRLKIRRHWQLFRWQSWMTLQFRFFEFVGPCRLILAGSRGVRAEDLTANAGAALPSRRTNQDATVGFTPNLSYRPVRAETFWGYYRGMNPLFDDLFTGRGVFICQQVASAGDARNARKFWSSLWGGVLKVFGL